MAENVEVLLRLRGSRQFVAQATSAAVGVEKVGKATDKTSTKADAATRRTDKFGSTLRKLGGAAKYAALGLGTMAGVGAVKAINAASDLSEEINKSSVIFGKSSDDILNWSKTSATAFGQSRTEALAAVGNFGGFFKVAGKGTKDAAQLSRSMVQLGGDMASFNNSTPQEALDALRSGLSGEVEPLRKFRVFLSDAALEQEATRQGMKKTGATFSDSQKIMLRMGVIMRQTKDAQGDFARTSGGLANQQRILKATVTDLAASVGTVLLPYMTKAVTAVAKFIAGMKDGTGSGGAFMDALRRAGDFISGTLWPAIKAVVGGLSDLVTGFQKGKIWAVAITIALAAFTAGLVTYKTVMFVVTAATKAWAVAQRMLNLAMATNPIVLVVALLVALGAALVVAYMKVEVFRNVVDTAFGAVKATAVAVFGWIKGHWPLLIGILGGPFGLVVALVIRNRDKIVAALAKLPGMVTRAVSGAFNGVKEAFRSAINWIIGKWNNLSIGMDAVKVAGHTVVPGVRINTPDVPLLAAGGTIGRGGAAMVGERGPELVRLPPAAQVIPNSALGGAGAGAPQTIVTQVFLDRRQIAEAVGSYASDRIARR